MAQTAIQAPPRSRILLGYGAMVAAGVLLFLLIRAYGETLTAPPAPPGSSLAEGAAAPHGSPLLQVLIALAAIIAASRALGAVCRWLHQPPVMGEVIAGLLLGPSLLGKIAPGVSHALFPASVLPLLGILAQIGVLLFMFLVGLELDTRVFREKTHTTVAISHASIVVPFLLGSALSLWLYPMLSHQGVPFTAFTLFLGVSMSVTAFPVLARILTDRGLQRTRMGTTALTCAALGDVTAWCLLAFVVGVIQSDLRGAGRTTVLTVLYVAMMFAVVRPLAHRFVARYEGKGSPGQQMMAIVCLVLLLSSLATEFIGIHTLFGAFLIGAVIPHDCTVARVLRERLQDFVVVMLLPAFFAFTGLRTQIGLISGAQWWVCGAIIAVACAGKFGGSVLAGRLTGMNWRDASALGILMNTRGLMELIVLNIGLDLKVISTTLFAMLVIMAVVTTLATTPILDALTRGTLHEEGAAANPCEPAPDHL
jgi:Kef-type K+ transport system membrane component KefB